jgi:hypothetical protein
VPSSSTCHEFAAVVDVRLVTDAGGNIGLFLEPVFSVLEVDTLATHDRTRRRPLETVVYEHSNFDSSRHDPGIRTGAREQLYE